MKRLLVWQTAFLGDVILTTPLLAALQQLYPDVALDTVTLPGPAMLMQDLPFVSRAYGYDKHGSERGPLGLWQLARQLKANDYDAVLCPHPSLRSSAALWLSGIPRRIGFEQATGAFLHTYRVERDTRLHEVERVLSLLVAMGEDPRHFIGPLQLEVNKESAASVAEIFKSNKVGKSDVLFGINPGSVWGTKRWLPERFAELADLAAEQFGLLPVLVGGPDDVEIASLVEKKASCRLINLAGRTDLRQLVAVINRCRLFLTNDSGPMHIAVARKIPTVAIFGATDSSLGYFPYDPKAVVVETELECRPCSHHGPKTCPLGHFRCMRDITTEQVYRACENLLQRQVQEV
jgi:lipopolysaccharide heptosyltransferase II